MARLRGWAAWLDCVARLPGWAAWLGCVAGLRGLAAVRQRDTLYFVKAIDLALAKKKKHTTNEIINYSTAACTMHSEHFRRSACHAAAVAKCE